MQRAPSSYPTALIFALLCACVPDLLSQPTTASKDAAQASATPDRSLNFEDFVPCPGIDPLLASRSRTDVHFAPLDREANRFTLAYHAKDGTTRTAVCSLEHRGDLAISAPRTDGAAGVVMLEMGTLREVGIIDVHGDGSDSLFVVSDDGGSACSQTRLALVNPGIPEIVSLAIGFDFSPVNPVTSLEISRNFMAPKLAAERAFLLGIRGEYGFRSAEEVRAHPENPKYAYYFWMEDNRNVTDGALKARRFPGRPLSRSVSDVALEEGGWTWCAQCRAGVVAYDQTKDEHMVLFHPNQTSASPSILGKTGHFLIIGTHGEGLAVVDLLTLRLRRIRLGTKSLDDVETLEVIGDRVLVNGTREVDVDAR